MDTPRPTTPWFFTGDGLSHGTLTTMIKHPRESYYRRKKFGKKSPTELLTTVFDNLNGGKKLSGACQPDWWE